MAENKKKYVVCGYMAKCSLGSLVSFIGTDVGHGVVYQGKPVLNANDHKKLVNLTGFGVCCPKRDVCNLDTPLPWMFTNGGHMVDGAPALTEESLCACRFGGIISIMPVADIKDGQED